MFSSKGFSDWSAYADDAGLHRPVLKPLKYQFLANEIMVISRLAAPARPKRLMDKPALHTLTSVMGGDNSLNKSRRKPRRIIPLESGSPSPNLVDVDDTLTEFNAEPSLWEALPEQDLTFDVDTDIAVWGALSDAEIVLDYNNTESDEDESEELTPVTLSEAKVSLNKLRNFSLQNHVDADILQASFVLEKSIDKVRLNALKQKR
ncbi:hypothetical protein TNCV_2970091 [Trichonephila clavipes]|nr:hypothetical protein TNCV_2970091 [Trichonephila clavipes]